MSEANISRSEVYDINHQLKKYPHLSVEDALADMGQNSDKIKRSLELSEQLKPHKEALLKSLGANENVEFVTHGEKWMDIFGSKENDFRASLGDGSVYSEKYGKNIYMYGQQGRIMSTLDENFSIIGNYTWNVGKEILEDSHAKYVCEYIHQEENYYELDHTKEGYEVSGVPLNDGISEVVSQIDVYNIK